MFLGRVIEKISGMSYYDFIKKHIMDPIGVTTCVLAGDTFKEKRPDEVTYYPLEFKSSPYSIKVARADSAFGLAMSPIDCCKFAYNWMQPAAYFRGGINGTQTFIYHTRTGH